MICTFPNCITMLSKKNKKNGLCYLHSKVIFQNEVVKKDNEFFAIKENTKSRPKSKSKFHKITLEEVAVLKELVYEEVK